MVFKVFYNLQAFQGIMDQQKSINPGISPDPEITKLCNYSLDT